jgi:hypothetical protein
MGDGEGGVLVTSVEKKTRRERYKTRRVEK